MRKSSKIVIIFSVLLLVCGAGLLFVQSESAVGPLNENQMRTGLDRFRNAVEQKDVDSIISQISPSANILGLRREELRASLARTMQDLGEGHLEIKFSNIKVKSSKSRATSSFDMEIGQKISNVDVSYYRPKINIELEKSHISRGFGLFDADEWIVTKMISSVDLDITPK